MSQQYAWVSLCLLVVCQAHAAEGVPNLCSDVNQRLAQATAELHRCEATQQLAMSKHHECLANLSNISQEVDKCAAVRDGYREQNDARCLQLVEMGRAVTQSEALPADLVSCMPQAQVDAVSQRLQSWAQSMTALQQLSDFAQGVSDTPPKPPRSNSTAGSVPTSVDVVGALLSSNLHQRLLVEAVERVAPNFWRHMQASGAAPAKVWLSAQTPLDAALVRESQQGGQPIANSAVAGPPLLAALKLVQLYQDLTGCDTHAPPYAACSRARQLQELLETNAPLVVRRREQAIWATDCATAAPATLLGWLQESPGVRSGADDIQWNKVAGSIALKLYTCFLSDSAADMSFSAWFERRAPGAKQLTGETLNRLDDLRDLIASSALATPCGHAVHALQRVTRPASCAVPAELHTNAWRDWQPLLPKAQTAHDATVVTCLTLARHLWDGDAAYIPAAFERPPGSGEIVHINPDAGTPPMAQLRKLCDDRVGAYEQFPQAFSELAHDARLWGETPSAPPWRAATDTDEPIEAMLFARGRSVRAWINFRLERTDACTELGLSADRCAACAGVQDGAYDCAVLSHLRVLWQRRTVQAVTLAVAAVAALVGSIWLFRLARAWRHYRTGLRRLRTWLNSIGIPTNMGDLWFLRPAWLRRLRIRLPATPAWERWGRQALLVANTSHHRVGERDVNDAGTLARNLGCDVAFVVHDNQVSVDFAALRATLEWASRGVNRAVHVLPVSIERLSWARSSDDLLELVEQTSWRGNPFDVRGRVTSSVQFFNRERLISGMLASIQAGQWLVVTGLRRFGKSSLALEVARRLPGLSTYVDLSGFYHEIALVENPAAATDAILEHVCMQLFESATQRYPQAAAQLPKTPSAKVEPLSARILTEWFGAFCRVCAEAHGGTVPVMIIIDEIEQAIGTGPDTLKKALDVFSILLGRLRAGVGDPLSTSQNTRVSVVFCSALHPVLWAPLSTMANQSLMGAFPSVCVPRLDEDVAISMMRSLGARQGVRFGNEAVAHIVQQGQGVPLLVRRLGSAILELFDAERARQGGLGAVDVGIEAARAAVQREEQPGSPLRVWVETEIADSHSPPGLILRHLARHARVGSVQLREEVEQLIYEQWRLLGMETLLGAQEAQRRAQEAAATFVRLLAETRLITAEGDALGADTYSLEDGLIRRILTQE